MNIELKPRKDLFWAAASAPANDNTERWRAYELSPPRAVIYKPAKSAMTSGRAGTKRWLLEFEPRSAPFIEPLMGWTGSTDPMAQVRLTFPSLEAAVSYAERHGLEYEVRGAAEPVKPCEPVAKPQPKLMPLWSIDTLPADWSRLRVSGGSAAGPAPNLAA